MPFKSMPVSVRRLMCVSGLMYRDALTTAANLGAFVRLIFIYPPREKGRREGGREEGNCVRIILRRPSCLSSFLPTFSPSYTYTLTHHRLRRTMISLSLSLPLVRLDDSRALAKRRKLSFDHSRAPTLHRRGGAPQMLWASAAVVPQAQNYLLS